MERSLDDPIDPMGSQRRIASGARAGFLSCVVLKRGNEGGIGRYGGQIAVVAASQIHSHFRQSSCPHNDLPSIAGPSNDPQDCVGARRAFAARNGEIAPS